MIKMKSPRVKWYHVGQNCKSGQCLKMLLKDKERFGQQRKAFSLDMGDLERDKGDFNM